MNTDAVVWVSVQSCFTVIVTECEIFYYHCYVDLFFVSFLFLLEFFVWLFIVSYLAT